MLLRCGLFRIFIVVFQVFPVMVRPLTALKENPTMRRLLRTSTMLFALAYSAPANAEFILSEMIVDVGQDAPRQRDIEVVSQDKEVQYIATETNIVENPGLSSEKHILVTDPQKSGLLVTPNKMVLPAGARKTMRLLLLHPQGEKDEIYRLIVKPVIQGVEETKNRMALKLLVGYEVLVIVRAKDGKIDVVAERKGNSLKLTNNGTTNANLQFGQQCDNTGSNCKEINVTRLYAGQSWSTTLPYLDGQAKYQVFDGKEMKEMTF